MNPTLELTLNKIAWQIEWKDKEKQGGYGKWKASICMDL